MKRKKRIIAISITIAILFVAVELYPGPWLYNNFLVARFTESLETIAFSKNTHTIIKTSKFGNLSGGNIKRCEAIAIRVVESDLNPEQFFSKFYSENLFEGIIFPYNETSEARSDNPWIVSAYFYDKGGLYSYSKTGELVLNGKNTETDVLDTYSYDVVYNLLEQNQTGKNIYLLFVTDRVYDSYALNDVRCYN